MFEAGIFVHSEMRIDAIITMTRRKYMIGLYSDRHLFGASLAGIFVQKKRCR